MKRRDEVRVFSSFEEENVAEHQRLAGMTPQERMREFAVLQARRWGEAWGERPIEKRATWERLSWEGLMMLFSADMKAFLRLFEEHGVQYVLVGGHAVNIISLEDLVQVKLSSDRPRDLADADELSKING